MSARELLSLFDRGRVCVLTGAGVSTDSGIPDYRGPGTLMRARNPVQYRQFMSSALARKRYWARSLVGFPKVLHARPNRAHEALVELEARDLLTGVITQNVDGLHVDAGTRELVELHGRLREVLCMACGAISSRITLQHQLSARNPEFKYRVAEVAPDGDAELDDALEDFHVIDCEACGGPLKPHVVFFGENVPKERVERCYAHVEGATSLLVVGSSLTVFSGYRFVKRAAEGKKPIAIVNLGSTRGDPHAQVRIEGNAAEVLSELAELVTAPSCVASSDGSQRVALRE